MPRFLLWLGAAAILAVLPLTVQADAIQQKVEEDCGGCHRLQVGDDSLEERQQRNGPPLWYAGNKFREDWLVDWLQAPTRIRPAGDYPPAHLKTTDKGDAVDAASLVEHPQVEPGDAAPIAAYLLSLKPRTTLLDEEDYTPGSVSERMGAMDFVKFKGCGACHKDTPKYGGVSGPELYTAWQRLQPAFITSYIRDPAAWETWSLMPNKELNSEAIYKLANYLRTIGEKSEKDQ